MKAWAKLPVEAWGRGNCGDGGDSGERGSRRWDSTPGQCRRSMPFVPLRTSARPPCKNLQAVPKQGSTTDLERPPRGTADPVFPGSAAMCCHCARPVTPEAAGSSPVDPANISFSINSLRRCNPGGDSPGCRWGCIRGAGPRLRVLPGRAGAAAQECPRPPPRLASGRSLHVKICIIVVSLEQRRSGREEKGTTAGVSRQPPNLTYCGAGAGSGDV
jgi:hypothetical protein